MLNDEQFSFENFITNDTLLSNFTEISNIELWQTLERRGQNAPGS
jgi:hypothetical protein